MGTYCQYIMAGGEGETFWLHKKYHDTQYGFPLQNDDELFGRLILEINQAGLSWSTILKKQENFRRAYHHYNIKRIARYDESQRLRLLSDSGIVRNRLKIDAVIYNARQVQVLQKQFGSFKAWLEAHHPQPAPAWVKLFKHTFRFTGSEIVNEFLKSTGYVPGAHISDCPIFKLLSPT